MSTRSSRSTTPAPGQSMRSRASSASSQASSRYTSQGSKKGSRRRSRRRRSNVSGSSLSSQGSVDRNSVKAKASMRGKTQFSKITALIKDKDRRAKKENPEGAENLVAYVDSARAVFALGSKDLRGDILKHRHKLKNEEDVDDTESPGFLLLIEQAEWDLNIRRFWSAVKYLNKASTIVADDVYVLTLRAHAKLGCQDYEGALTDANRVLVFLREPYNPGALIARGDAYYFLGKFEHALVSYYRAGCQDNLLTKEKEHLKNVMARAKNAILNAVGDNTDKVSTLGNEMQKMLKDESFQLDLDQKEEEEDSNNEEKSIDQLIVDDSAEKMEKEKLEDVQLLEEFAADKAFLENILVSVADNNKIKDEVETTLKFLTQRKYFWKQHGTSLKK